MKRDNVDRNAPGIYKNLETSGWTVRRIASAVQRNAGVARRDRRAQERAPRKEILETRCEQCEEDS